MRAGAPALCMVSPAGVEFAWKILMENSQPREKGQGLTPVARRLVRTHRYKGPLEGCPNAERHAVAGCRFCTAIQRARKRRERPTGAEDQKQAT